MENTNTSSCSMFGAFNLQSGKTLLTFQLAFDAFCTHLKEVGYVPSWRVWERAYHDGYDTRFPDVSVMIEMRFHTYEAAMEAWDYIESKSEPMHGLHVAMNMQVTDSYFVLCNEVR